MIEAKLSDYLKGKLKIDEYVTHHRKFAEINEGFHDMHVCQICKTPACLVADNLFRGGIASAASLTCLKRQ